ncbi:hypothetical protein WA556_003606, partial [Blastocystis sp. ATCC 50177/Nand II]
MESEVTTLAIDPSTLETLSTQWRNIQECVSYQQQLIAKRTHSTQIQERKAEEERNRLATERGLSSTPSDRQEASAHYAPSPIREAEPMNPISSPLSPAAPADQSNDDD